MSVKTVQLTQKWMYLLDSWADLSRSAREAAQSLATGTNSHPRSSISRAYYAAYSAITGELVKQGVVFPHGRNNPPHAELRRYVDSIRCLTVSERRDVRRAIRRLWAARVDADYIITVSQDAALARDMLRDAHKVMGILGVYQ